jgi:DNA-directed RNA polymerase-3 subunit RPC5
MDIDDPVVSVIPIQLSSALDPHLQLLQYPLLSRPLTVPPSADNASKNITARCKPKSDRMEIHVPFDTRQEVWNQRRGLEYGDARREEDGKKPSSREESRLEELRLRSERVPHRGVYMVGALRGSKSRIPPSCDL